MQIVQRLIPGGIEMLALELAERLPGTNTVLSLEWTYERIVGNWPAIADVPCLVEGLDKPAGLTPLFVRPLARRLKALKPRAVLTHHIGPLLYGGIAARLAGVPVVAHVEHDVWHYRDPRRRLMARFAATLARPKVVAISRRVEATLREVMPGADIVLIPNAVDTERFVPASKGPARAALGLPQEARIIGAAGRLEQVKGQDVLIRALAQVPNALLALVGDGSQRAALEALAAEMGVAERTVFLGHRSQMPAIYPAFDVLCLPSRNEGLPLSVLEAEACGIPVVATDVGSVREGICPATGAVVPPEDPAALAAALVAALDAPAGVSPRDFVLAHYSWDHTLAAYRTLTDPA